jgi:hypothetical protein
VTAAAQADALRAAARSTGREGTAGVTVTVSAGGEIAITAGACLFTLITLAVAAHLGRHRLAITSTRPEGEPA